MCALRCCARNLVLAQSLCAPSPQFFDTQTEGLVRLPRCRHNPELLHQLQTTLVSPAFDNFAAPEVIDVHASKRYVLPCRGKSPYGRYLDIPSVCSTDGPAPDDLVPFRKEVLDRRTEIGKRGAPS